MTDNGKALPSPPRKVWRGSPLRVPVLNALTNIEARVYGLLAMHAATRTRVTFTDLGGVTNDDDVPIGALRARRTVNDLHELGLVMVSSWNTATADTRMSVYLSGMEAPARPSRHLSQGEDRVKVGGRFTAPRTLDPALLDTLSATARRLARHQEAPAAERDAAWIEALADMTEQRAIAFRRWASIDATPGLTSEADRLEAAVQDIRRQALNRRRADRG